MAKTQTVHKNLKRETKVINAEGLVLGRVAGEAVKFLMGKHKVNFSSHTDTGDSVTIQNADKIKVTGNKLTAKEYMHYSQYPGGLKRSQLSDELDKNPARVLRRAIARMLPRNKQRQPRMARLTIIGETGTHRIW